jgi:hypothetical protein
MFIYLLTFFIIIIIIYALAVAERSLYFNKFIVVLRDRT